MTLYRQTEYKSQLRRKTSKEAILLAMENRWEEAVSANHNIVELFPQDIEAYNRLGKALVELGRYRNAKVAFQTAVAISPSNTIAQKNLERLSHLKQKDKRPKKTSKIAPSHFLEESGKTATTTLEKPVNQNHLAKLAPGDPVKLQIIDRRLSIDDWHGNYLGLVPPRLSNRILRLIDGGNRYDAAITSVSDENITIIIREEYQDPSQRGIQSFQQNLVGNTLLKPVRSGGPARQNGKLDSDADAYWDEEEEALPDYSGSAFLMDVTSDDEAGSLRLDS